MATHAYVRHYVHLVWSTYKRERIFTREIRLQLFEHLVERCKELGVVMEKLNVQPEHVHMLFQQPFDKTLPEIPKLLKGESSHWLNEQQILRGKFRWQRGYGSFSVSASLVEKVKNYIAHQDEHHHHKTFAEEYQAWAQQYGVWAGDDDED